MFFDKPIFPQTLKKVLYIALSKLPAHAELSNDLTYDFWLGRPIFKEFEDSRSDEVEVEHLALPDIEGDCAVLSVCAAHCVRNSMHLEPLLPDV